MTRKPRRVELENINLVVTQRWRDLISGAAIEEEQEYLELSPYQTVWLTNS
jgi:sucrose phosphorylase